MERFQQELDEDYGAVRMDSSIFVCHVVVISGSKGQKI